MGKYLWFLLFFWAATTTCRTCKPTVGPSTTTAPPTTTSPTTTSAPDTTTTTTVKTTFPSTTTAPTTTTIPITTTASPSDEYEYIFNEGEIDEVHDIQAVIIKATPDSLLTFTGTKVLNGIETAHGDFPHQVSLQATNKDNIHFCGASIIHPRYLLTAAHCFVGTQFMLPHVRAVAGEHTLKSHGDTEQIRQVTRIILHEKYYQNETTWVHDIALLELNVTLDFNGTYVRPIALWHSPWRLPEMATVSGWGYTDSSGKLTPAKSLLMAEIKIRKHGDCVQKFRNHSLTVAMNTICAGGLRDACKGDSGGPLTCSKHSTHRQQHQYLCGIVSWGVNCDKEWNKFFPGVYTDVSKYTKWIKQKTTRVSAKREATPGDYPYQVSIQTNTQGHNFSHICCATIIHPKFLLSQAFCIDRHGVPNRAVAGEHDLSVPDGNREQIRSVTRVIKHENYNDSTNENGIVLVELSEPLNFDDKYVHSVPLWDPSWELPQWATVSGWGGTHATGYSQASRRLMAAHVEIRDRRECARIFRRLKNITNDVICAGNTRDVCNGDAGNPLTCLKKFPNGQQQRYLCGMASWGANCEQRDRSYFPTVFTNVAIYKGWVERNLPSGTLLSGRVLV